MHAQPFFPPASDADPAGLRQRMADLLRHMPAAVVVHDAGGAILAANRLACQWLQADEAQLCARETNVANWALLGDDGRPLAAHEFPVSRVLAQAAPVSDLVIGLPGPTPLETRWMLVNAYPEAGRDGAVERVIVCFTDCTEIKRAEARVRKSEERLSLALKGSNDGAWDWDLVTGEMYCSERWWEILGYQPGERDTDGTAWRSLVHPDDQEDITAFIDAVVSGRRQIYSVEFRLLHRDGHSVTVLSRGYVQRDALGTALRLSGTNTDLTERKKSERRIHELAYYDPLTGLPNRRYLIEYLSRAMAPGTTGCGAVLFIDLDNFKSLNDTRGHLVGDRLLEEVARRLNALAADWPAARPCVARLGGDEFVIVLDAAADAADTVSACARQLAERALVALGQPYQLGLHAVHSTPSIGIALFDAQTGGTEAVLMQADLAMYRAKADGRNTVRQFTPSMRTEAEHRAALEAGLRRGIERREFILHYQPKFDRGGRLIGAEALVRWRRDDGELVMPGEFIALAEETGLILPLGHQIGELACATLARWAGMPGLSNLQLAVNVSVHQLRDPGLQGRVVAALAASGAAPERLQLEITESVFAGDLDAIARSMHALRALGLTFALDDFGTGYSSLAYLKRLPLSTLKIDRAFVNDLAEGPQGASIVSAIIGMAHTLGLDVVAEGVETEAQRDFLAQAMCDAMQGYLLGRPIALDEFERRFGAGG